MLNAPVLDVVHGVNVPKTYPAPAACSLAAGTAAVPNYDSVSISSGSDNRSVFQKELVSRLSKEIRVSTTTGKIQQLRQAVSTGEYHPDPARIAKSMLCQLGGILDE